MIDPDVIAAIYDFPGIFEPALQTLFVSRGITAFTSQAVASTGDALQDQELVEQGFEIIDYQKDRPRVEILFVPGSGQERFRPTLVEGVEIPLEVAWAGQFKVDVFTLPDVRMHRAYVTMVRFILHTRLLQVNAFLPDGTTPGNPGTLKKHRIQNYQTDSGTTPHMQPEPGVFQTSLIMDINFSIQDDAWADFNPDIEGGGGVQPQPSEPILDAKGFAILDAKGKRILGF